MLIESLLFLVLQLRVRASMAAVIVAMMPVKHDGDNEHADTSYCSCCLIIDIEQRKMKFADCELCTALFLIFDFGA
jgi:hypothetical protein